MVPKCPKCNSEMVIRVARRGPNAGNEFWGCSTFPACKHTRDRNDVGRSESSQAAIGSRSPQIGDRASAPFRPRVEWIDPSISRVWDTLYTLGGGTLRSTEIVTDALTKEYPEALRRLQQTFTAVSPPDLPTHTDTGLTQVVGTFRKILERGDWPPHDPGVERALLEKVGASEALRSSDDPGDLSFRIDQASIPVTEEEVIAAALLNAEGFELRSDLQLDSMEEHSFIAWMSDEFGPEVARWLYPQAPFSALLNDPADTRRTDFLYAPPWGPPVIFEIDGKQHDTQIGVDDRRDEELGGAGYQVVRILASHVRDRNPSSLPDLRFPAQHQPSDHAQVLVHGPAQITRLGLAIAESVERGFLPLGDRWCLEVRDALGITESSIGALLELFASVDELWAGYTAPPEVQVTTGRGSFSLVRTSQSRYERGTVGELEPPHARFILEHDKGPNDKLDSASIPTVVLRPSSLPVALADRRAEGSSMAVVKEKQALEEPLLRVLRYVFAKEGFREGQFNAIAQTLSGRDCLVLLPTGAGKSLIYQLAGLLMPGRTLILDPIVALMEDQVEGLKSFGIDRAIAMSSFVTQQGLARLALEQVRNGDALFFFISPERLQAQSFRDSLQTLTATTPINVATVDEAHCISEWGHDFRPAYLNIGPLIRRLCRSASGEPPPLLALTGTASRAVLRDILIELHLDRSDPDSVIKPESFNRDELTFEVVTSSPGETRARLIGAVKAIPSALGARPGKFFDQGSRPPNLGVVFCPHVNGEFGVLSVADDLRGAVTPHVGYYAGSAPRGVPKPTWQHQKRETADAFRKGDITLLCATNAFGMGIDIPSIRYTVHLGIPSSIEAFYQEAGRAGRDRRNSRCMVVFTEMNARTNELRLSDSTDGEEARALYDAQGQEEDDDIRRQLFFFFETFQGQEVESNAVTALLDELQWSGTAKTIEVPFAKEPDQTLRERAILRLIQVGAVNDYLKDWGSKTFKLHLAEAGPDDLDAAFIEFVVRTQPGRVVERRQAIANLRQDPARRAEQLALMTVELLYDSVEKSRRRALREMRLLVAAGASDQEIRTRIEDYFREGDLAPQLETMTEAAQLNLSQWSEAYLGLTAADEGELRGSTARLLESYPDHPGLLLGRALAELIAGDDRYEFADDMGRAFEFGRTRYSMSSEDLGGMATLMLDFATLYRPTWRPLVWDKALPHLDGEDPWEVLVTARGESAAVPGERVMYLNERLSAGVQAVIDLVGNLHGGGRHE